MKTRILTGSFSLLWAIVLSFVALSCSDEQIGTIYEGESSFAFNSGVLNAELGASDMNQILVPISRGSFDESMAELKLEFENAQGEWVDSDPEGLFSLVAKRVLFADGSYSANAQIHYSDLNKLGIGKKYRMRLTILGELSPSQRGSVVITASRKLTFTLLGKCEWTDVCLFDGTYSADIYKAEEAAIYRVSDPYSEGLVAEEYADAGWMGTPSEFVQFQVLDDGSIVYEPFCTGMKVQGRYLAWAYYPGEYQWGKDFSSFNSRNRQLSEKVFQLYPVYCLPDFQYGFLNEGAYPLTIVLP